MKHVTQKALLGLAVAFLLFVFFSAFRFGAAEVFSMSASRNLEDLQSAKHPASLAQIEAVARQFEIARFLVNTNPFYHEDIARLDIWRAAIPEAAPSEKRALLLAGLTEIRSAILLQPVSPYHWTTLLIIKRELGEFDLEFRHALQRAVALGPWEPLVIASLADVGLSAWTELPSAEQTLIQQVFVRGMKNQRDQMLAIVRAYRSKCAAPSEGVAQKPGCR